MTHGVQRLLDLVAFAVAGCVLSGCGGSTERAGIDRAVRAPACCVHRQGWPRVVQRADANCGQASRGAWGGVVSAQGASGLAATPEQCGDAL